MKRPSILHGLVLAFLAAALATPIYWTMLVFLPFHLAFKSVAMLAFLTYLAYLLWSKGDTVGSLTLSAANLALAALVIWIPLNLAMTVVVLAVCASLNRSLLWHRSLLSLSLDGTLIALGIFFAGYLYDTTFSLPGSLWGFLLLQSLWPLIPSRIPLAKGLGPDGNRLESDPFVASRRQAEAALERIVEGGEL